jgi:hypothetical protein
MSIEELVFWCHSNAMSATWGVKLHKDKFSIGELLKEIVFNKLRNFRRDYENDKKCEKIFSHFNYKIHVMYYVDIYNPTV